ncbi:hypothetical protein ACJDT4_01220 [Clostridium neuense]|uniref:Uncharacterized protein n=1 Tax=Clostridium neuense TaxID=1728934 RepID=A0ABW8T946_9CLOT
MKRLRKFILWMTIGILIENGCFLYFNNYFLVKKLYVTSKNVSSSTLNESLIKLPSKANNIKISDDGKYAAYSLGNTICVSKLTTKKVSKIPVNSDEELILFKWMPYKDEIYYLLKTPTAKTSYSIKQYNILKANYSSSTNIQLQDNSYSKSKNNFTIKDLQSSISVANGFIAEIQNPSGVSFLRAVNNSLGTQNIYPYNSSEFSDIINFCPVNIDYCYLYQDLNNSNIYTNVHVYNGFKFGYNNLPKALQNLIVPVAFTANETPQYLKLDNIKNPLLLGSDTLGNLYIGSLNDKSKISSIYTVNLMIDTLNFKKLSLKNAEDEKNILITTNCGIFIVHKNYVINLKNKRKTKYSGKFVQISNNKLFYIYKGSLISCDIS